MTVEIGFALFTAALLGGAVFALLALPALVGAVSGGARSGLVAAAGTAGAVAFVVRVVRVLSRFDRHAAAVEELPAVHSSLITHARCLYDDEFRPTPECELDHDERHFVEELTFADADALIGMMQELCPHVVDGNLPVWIRNLAYRLALLQRPDDPALLRRAADNLWLHGPDWDDIAADLTRRADALEAT